MARRLIWSHRAADELQDIAVFIAKDSPAYAGPVVARFLNRAGALADQPSQGRRVPEYQGVLVLREVFVHRWRLIYAVSDDKIEIVTIVHGARLMENAKPL